MATLRACRTRRHCRQRRVPRRRIPVRGRNVQFPRPFVEGVIARMANDEYKAQLAFTAAREKQEKT